MVPQLNADILSFAISNDFAKQMRIQSQITVTIEYARIWISSRMNLNVRLVSFVPLLYMNDMKLIIFTQVNQTDL